MKKLIYLVSLILFGVNLFAQVEGLFGVPVSYDLDNENPGVGIEIGVINLDNTLGFGIGAARFQRSDSYRSLTTANLDLLWNVNGTFLISTSAGIESKSGKDLAPYFGFGGRYLFEKFYIGVTGNLSFPRGLTDEISFSRILVHMGFRF